MNPLFRAVLPSLLALSLALTGCAPQPIEESLADRPPVSDRSLPKPMDPVLQARILALDPGHITDQDVRQVLVHAPTPRIILLHGGVYPVYLVMASFGHFLTEMGYPESRIRDPGSGAWSYSPYRPTRELAGLVAWQYEHDGVEPMLIGHSQGGLSAVKILKDLAGQNGDDVQVWNPVTDAAEDRTTIVDPYTGRTRPVVGVKAAYASAIGAGGWALVLPAWWENLETLRRIPDTVDEFTGYFIEGDLIALSLPGNPLDKRYESDGTAQVRNVTLPPTYNHVIVPVTDTLGGDPKVRSWINAYVPGDDRDTSSLPGDAAQHVIWAADVWYSIKKHWCLEAQRWVRAQSKRVPTENAAK